MRLIELRHHFETQAEVQIQRQCVGRGGHPGLEHARAVSLPERFSLGQRGGSRGGTSVFPARRRRARPYGDSVVAALMASEAVFAASCNDLVDRCA
jgi:hypothetical protein